MMSTSHVSRSPVCRTAQDHQLVSNPFSVQRLSSGKLKYVGLSGAQITDLVDCFVQANCMGQIVGPHGSGKSTLTLEFERQLQTRSPEDYLLNRKTIDSRWRVRSASALAEYYVGDRSENVKRVVVLDGIEKLTWHQRLALMVHCRCREIGLLVTSHRRIWGLPVLLRTQPSLKTFFDVVSQAQLDSQFQISAEHLETIYRSANGDIREALMICYDTWENQRSISV